MPFNGHCRYRGLMPAPHGGFRYGRWSNPACVTCSELGAPAADVCGSQSRRPTKSPIATARREKRMLAMQAQIWFQIPSDEQLIINYAHNVCVVRKTCSPAAIVLVPQHLISKRLGRVGFRTKAGCYQGRPRVSPTLGTKDILLLDGGYTTELDSNKYPSTENGKVTLVILFHFRCIAVEGSSGANPVLSTSPSCRTESQRITGRCVIIRHCVLQTISYSLH